jgi:hypothetical protein
MRPVIIAVAITGSVPRKKDNPALPVLPAEQIESTHASTSMCATTTSPRRPTRNVSGRYRRACAGIALA